MKINTTSDSLLNKKEKCIHKKCSVRHKPELLVHTSDNPGESSNKQKSRKVKDFFHFSKNAENNSAWKTMKVELCVTCKTRDHQGFEQV